MAQAREDAGGVEGRVVQRQRLERAQQREELAAVDVLGQHVQPLAVLVRVDEAQQERVPHRGHDAALVQHVALLLQPHDRLLLQHLQREHGARGRVAHEEDAAEGADADRDDALAAGEARLDRDVGAVDATWTHAARDELPGGGAGDEHGGGAAEIRHGCFGDE